MAAGAVYKLTRLLVIGNYINCCYNNRPRRDSRGQVHRESKQTTNDITESQSSLLSNDNNKGDDEVSVKLLDEILTKAQTVRDLSKVI